MRVELIPATPDLAPALYHLVAESREFLGAWLPWVAHINAEADEVAFLSRMQQEHAVFVSAMHVIKVDDHVAGAIDLHNIDQVNRHADVGYWLGQRFTGQGVMHTALSELEAKAFGNYGLHKLNLVIAMDNAASRRVADSAGYRMVATLPAELLISERYHNAALYSKLAVH